MVPTVAERVWGAFWRLDGRRNGNGYCANAVSDHEIAEHGRLRGFVFRDWELAALDAMERARLAYLNRDEKRQTSARPMSAGLFDAMFDR